jgi:adenine deaminase
VNVRDYDLGTFRIPAGAGSSKIRVIGVRENDLYTDEVILSPTVEDGLLVADKARDLCKVLVFDRHRAVNVARAFAQGFGLARGAIATTIGHDSHNLAVAGMCDADMLAAVDEVVRMNGGIAIVVDGAVIARAELAIAGLMSSSPLETAIADLNAVKDGIRELGTSKDILMILHFIQLPVIPALKLTDRGLVDVLRQQVVPLTAE